MGRAANLVALWALVGVLSWQTTSGIVYRRANSSNLVQIYPRREYIKKNSYLNLNRPLWVLEDKVSHPGEIHVGTQKPITRKPFISSAVFHPRLPSHYLNLNTAAPMRSAVATSRNADTRQRTRIFPVFEDADTDPILIYRGSKAKMIFNTMMTSRRYPMKEPVPGQVMYPPYSPKFKPTPSVERVHLGTHSKGPFHNVTLIPFYPHEAIDPRRIRYETSFKPMNDFGTKQTNSFKPTSDVYTSQESYASNLEPTAESSLSQAEVEYNQEETQNFLTQEDVHPTHRPGCYHSYYSLDDVQSKYWSLPHIPSDSTTPMTLIRNLPIPNGVYTNHRMEATTPMPRASEDAFRILYPSDVETASPKRYKSVHTAKYGGFKAAHPIYTLNKLLKYNPQKNTDKPAKRDTAGAELIRNSRRKTLSSRSSSMTHHRTPIAPQPQLVQ